MGVVYLAKDELLDREVAIKFMSSDSLSATAEERFRREARIVAKMDHPSIVTLFDIGKHEDSLFIVMPFVPGSNLRFRMEHRILRFKDVIDAGIQIADALDYSHTAGVIHRDIKPENVLVQQDASELLRVRVTDFGLARQTSENRLTQSGALVGTVEYLSPEQVLETEIDGRSDIYSLGTVLYECFVGDTPFTGEIHTVVYRLAHDQPASPRSLGINIPEELEDILMNCLEKDLRRRPQKASELAQKLIQFRSQMQEGETLCAELRGQERITRVSRRSVVEPMIGRAAEITELLHRLNGAATGECEFVMVTGDAGLGKSHLLQELENLARARKINVLHGRFADHYQTFPYQGFGELIREYLHARRNTGQIPDFSDLAADLAALFPMLSEFEVFKILSPQTGQARFEDRQNIFELLARALSRMTEGKPIVILLEDLHAASASIEALHYIFRRLAATPTLIVGAARISELETGHPLLKMIESFEGDRYFLHLPLAPLSFKEYESFVEFLCGNKSLDPEFVKNIFQTTDGNPYFTKELLRSFSESKSPPPILLADSGELPAAPLPSTIQQAVRRRIERLPERSREVLAAGSVLGRMFDYSDLEALTGEDAEEIVDSLVRSGLLEESRESRGERLSFSSGLVREVLYSELPPRKRQSFHRKFGEYLEQRFQSRLERVYPELIHHYSQANVSEKVVEYGLKFARRSLSTFSDQDAYRTAQTVLRFLKDADIHDPLLEVETRKVLAECHRMAGRWDQAIQETEVVIELLGRHQEADGMQEAIVFLVETSWLGRKLETLRTWVERGIEMARVSGQVEVHEKLLSIAATAANLRCEYGKAQEYVSQLESIRRQQPAQDEEEIQAGGTLMVGFSAAVHAQHPAEIRVDEENEILANVFETLITTDAQGNLLPLLSTRWEPLNEGRAFLFTLQEGIRMHGGRTLTAALIKSAWQDSIQRCRKSLPAAFAAILGVAEFLDGSTDHVSGLLAFSDLKLGIQMKERLPMYPALLTDTRTAVGWSREDSIAGTGAFVISSFTSSHVILQRYELYWRARAILDRIDFKCSLTAREIGEGLSSGRFDLVRDLPASDIDEIRQRSRSQIAEAARKNVYYVLLNQNSPAFSSVEVRHAFSASVRTQDLVRTTLGRSAQPAESLLPPGIFCYDPGRRRLLFPLEEAREILSAVQPMRLRVAAHPHFLDRYSQLTKTLFQFWSDFGVELTVITIDMKTYLEKMADSEGCDLILGRWIADYDDPDNFTYGLFGSEQGAYRTYYSSAALDAMIDEARTEILPEKRDNLYREIENHLLDTGLFLPLFHEVYYRVGGPHVRRLRLRSVAPYVNYAEIGKVEAGHEISESKTHRETLQIPVCRQLPSMDPSLAFLEVSGEVLPSVFETLIQYEEGARTTPLLAAEYSAEDGGRRFSFRLRDDVTFHNGRPLTARDVRFSFERFLKNPDSKSRSLLFPILGAKAVYSGQKEALEGFKILSPLEFVIDLEYPLSFFPALLSFPATAIIAEGSDPTQSNWQNGCVGTGAFRVSRFEAGRKLHLEANPTYWRKGYPKSESLVFTFGLAPETIASGFRSGRFSIASDLLPEDVENLRREPDYVSCYRETPRLSTEYIAFNINRAPLDTESIRQQLAKAIDARTLVKRKLGRLGIPGEGILPPGLLGYEPAAPMKSSAPSTYPHLGIRLTACISPRHQGRYVGLAEEIFQVWEKMGVQITVLHPTESEYAQILNSPDVDLAVTGWTADYPDPDTFTYGALHSEQGADGRFCGMREMDQLSEKARSEQDPNLRHEIYRQIEKMIARRAVLIPLFHEQTYRFSRPQVQNLKLNLFFPVVAYDALWIEN